MTDSVLNVHINTVELGASQFLTQAACGNGHEFTWALVKISLISDIKTSGGLFLFVWDPHENNFLMKWNNRTEQ